MHLITYRVHRVKVRVIGVGIFCHFFLNRNIKLLDYITYNFTDRPQFHIFIVILVQ